MALADDASAAMTGHSVAGLRRMPLTRAINPRASAFMSKAGIAAAGAPPPVRNVTPAAAVSGWGLKGGRGVAGGTVAAGGGAGTVVLDRGGADLPVAATDAIGAVAGAAGGEAGTGVAAMGGIDAATVPQFEQNFAPSLSRWPH